MTKVKIVKNKVAPPFRKAEFEIEYGKGINRLAEIADMAVDYDIIHKSGSWFSYEDAKICQGRNNLLTLLEDNLEFLEEVEKQIKDRIMEKENPDLDKLIENIEN